MRIAPLYSEFLTNAISSASVSSDALHLYDLLSITRSTFESCEVDISVTGTCWMNKISRAETLVDLFATFR